MMQLAAVVEASARVAQTGSRLAKRDAIAACLRAAAPDEVAIAVAYLSGETRQRKLGVGYAALSALRSEAASQPSLTLREVDDALARITASTGKGSAAQRNTLLHALFARATRAEQDFLIRLIAGELRQGALEGVMVDAIAAAASLPVADVRRAAMFAADLGEVARTALGEGAPGLARMSVGLQRPVLPMLAQPAEDIADAIQRLGTAALEWKVDGARVQVHKAGRRGARVHAHAQRGDRVGAGDRRRGARAAGARAGARRRGDRDCARRCAAAVSSDDATLRPQARRRALAHRAAARGVLLRLPALRRRLARRPARARTFRGAGRRVAGRAGRAAAS